ncbi:MAG: hypothetical protein BAJALOKI2v1_500013 [Promethearchaeota archaeon]|nr:MAG: hypothetical protein BAJALOKI2v1_500013 [Candidatus Lokiarchaeota archaeon]
MEESEKQNLYITFKGVIESIIEEKKENPKREELVKNLTARINIGLQMEEEYYFWVNLKADDGNYSIKQGRLDEYDLEIKSAPEDLMFFANGTNSILHMLFKKNRFDERKLRFGKGTSGYNLGLLLKLPKILVLDKK